MSPARLSRPMALVLSLILFAILLPTTALAEDPSSALNLDAEAQRIHDRCAEALANCNQQNCDQHNGYSGCAVDCIGCFGPTVSWALNAERWEMHPSFGTCVLPLIEGYVAEVEAIQADYVSRAINVYQQAEAERAVRDIVSEAMPRCEQEACQAHCADLGVQGGMQGWDCVCDPLPEPTEDSSGGADTSDQVQGRPEADPPAGEGPDPTGSAGPDGGETDRPAQEGPDAPTAPDEGEASADTSPEDESPPRLKTFRIRPINSFSIGEIYGYARVTYELQEVYSDGTTGRRCTLRFSGWGAMIGFAVNMNFSPGYQWTEMDVRSGRMSLEDFHQVKGYHSSSGGLLGGWSGMYFATKDDAADRRAQTSGTGWSVGPWAGLDWIWGTWEIIEGPTSN